MNEVDLRQRFIAEIGDELGQPIQEFGEHPEPEDFERVKKRKLEEVEDGSPEAEALTSISFDDVRGYIY
jgi:hypothetical protein